LTNSFNYGLLLGRLVFSKNNELKNRPVGKSTRSNPGIERAIKEYYRERKR